MEHGYSYSLDVDRNMFNVSEPVLRIYLQQILEGLDYMHKQKIVHKDVKCANILLFGNVVKLADFNVAERLLVCVNFCILTCTKARKNS